MFEIVVETYHNHGEPSASPVRVRPLPGQLRGEYNVWCSKAAREVHPVGALFRVWVTVVHRDNAKPQLRIGLDQQWQLVTPTASRRFIGQRAREG